MHIKLVHLRTGKFLCQSCNFSANFKNSIVTHYKIKHPDQEQDFEEKSDEECKDSLTHEFWKAKWGIPTLAERKGWVVQGQGLGEEGGGDPYSFQDETPLPPGGKKRKLTGLVINSILFS